MSAQPDPEIYIGPALSGSELYEIELEHRLLDSALFELRSILPFRGLTEQEQLDRLDFHTELLLGLDLELAEKAVLDSVGATFASSLAPETPPGSTGDWRYCAPASAYDSQNDHYPFKR